MTWNIFDHELFFSLCNSLFFILFNEYKEYNIRNIIYLIKSLGWSSFTKTSNLYIQLLENSSEFCIVFKQNITS